MFDKHIIVVGSGVAAKCVIFELNKKGFKNITCISSEVFAPACSNRSTGINALRGTEAGLSPLGNKLIRAHEFFNKFLNDYSPKGVTKTYEVHGWSGIHSKLKRRYKTVLKSDDFLFLNKKLKEEINYSKTDAFVISPDLFLSWMEKEIEYKSVDDFVTKISKNNIETQKGDVYQFDKLVLATGFLARQFESLIEDPKIFKNLLHSKSVSGSFLELDSSLFNNSNLELKESFSFVYEDTHLIYREDENKIIIGSTSDNNEVRLIPNKDSLFEKYNKLKKLIGGEFPPFDEATFKAGVRHKAQQRDPFWGEINNNIYAVWGLYKTGWSMSFSAGFDIADIIEKRMNSKASCFEFNGIQISSLEFPLDQKTLEKNMHLLDEKLISASDKRKSEYIGGRICANELFSKHKINDLILKNDDKRRPIWPASFVGSITHSKDKVYASVAKSSDYKSIGIDAELIMSEKRRVSIQEEILMQEELELYDKHNETKELIATIVFSAKEALYKLINPLTNVFFGFEHAQVLHINFQAMEFKIELNSDLNELKAFNAIYEGEFRVRDNEVLTALSLS